MGQQQFKVGDEGTTRGGLRYRVVAVDDSPQPVMSVITTRSGREHHFWHYADGRLNVTDDPDFWLVSPAAGFFRRIIAAFWRMDRAA